MKKSVFSCLVTWALVFTVMLTMLPAGLVLADGESPAGSAGTVIFDEDCSSLADLTAKGWKVNDPKSLIYITDNKNTTGNPEGVINQPVPEGQILFYADEAAPKDDNGVSSIKLIDKQNLLKDKMDAKGKWYVEFNAKFDSLMKLEGKYIGDSGFSTFIDTGSKVYRITFSPDNKVIVRNGTYGNYVKKDVDLHIGDGKLHSWAISCHGDGVLSIVCDGKQMASFTGIDIPSKEGYTSWGDYGIQFINASLYGAAANSGENKIFFDSMKFVVNETAPGAEGSTATDLIFEDNCSDMEAAGWNVVQAPKLGVYINDQKDFAKDTININPIKAPDGQYILYGDNTVLPKQYSSIERSCVIGSGGWELQFDAKFKDLITPKANAIYRGISFEIFANGSQYKITFNDDNKILLMTNAVGTAWKTAQANMPSDDAFHKWVIGYNGSGTIYINLDDSNVAVFKNILVGKDTLDKVAIINSSLDWKSGINEAYIDNIKMVRMEATEKDPNLVFEDKCENLDEGGWTGIGNFPEAYITDSKKSFCGSLSNIKDVPSGQYLFYGVSRSSGYPQMLKNPLIGASLWALEFDARFVDLMTPGANNYGRGFQIEVYYNKRRVTINLNDENKLYIGADTKQTPVELPMPTDDKFHKWGIALSETDPNSKDKDKIIISIDGKKVASFVGKTTDAATSPDAVYFKVLPLNWKSGTTEVYMDNIKMVKNDLPKWAKYDPRVNGCTSLQTPGTKDFNIAVSTDDVDPVWYKDEKATVQVAVYKEDQLIAAESKKLVSQYTNFTLNTGDATGNMKFVSRLMYDGTKIDELVKNIEINSSMEYMNEGQTVVSEPDKVYVFNQMEQMKDAKGRDVQSAGWRKAPFVYDGTNESGTVIETVYDSQPLTLPVNLKGWFGVYVGYVSGTQEFNVSDGFHEENVVIERIDKYALAPVVDAEPYGSKVVSETFALASNLDNNSIEISKSNGRNARIAYIKVKGLTAEEIALYKKADEGANGKRVVYNNDGTSDFSAGYYTDVDKFKELAVDRYIGQDTEELDWCLGTTFMLNYDSIYTGKPYQGITKEQEDTLMRDVDKKSREQMNALIDSGKNPPQVFAQRAQEMGMKANVSLRMNAFYSKSSYPWLSGAIYDNYVNDKVDMRYVNKDGTKLDRLSYAYPEFRQMVKNILKEASSFQYVDGVNLDFCRYNTVIGYEPIVTEAYKNRYGIDPKNETTPEGITRWNQYRADIMTSFIREVRNELKGKTLSIRVPYKTYLEDGFDLNTWIKEGLIDVLIPSCIGIEEFYDITPFANMVKGSNVKLYGGINADLAGHDLTREEEDLIKRGIPVVRSNKYLSLQQYRLRANEMYKAGCEKIYIFNDWKGRESLGMLGDKVKLEKWYEFAYPSEWVKNSVTVSSPVSEYLTSIKVGDKTVGNFVYDEQDCVVTIPYGTVKVPEVSVGTVDPKAKVEFTNAATLKDKAIVKVTSSDGNKTMEYNLSFKETVPSEYPSSLMVGGKTVADFVYNKTEYVIKLPYGTVDVPKIKVETEDPYAKVYILNASDLEYISTVVVTSSDAKRSKMYRFGFEVETPISAYLTGIKVGNKTVGDFVYDKTDYVITLDYGTVGIPGTSVETLDPKAMVDIKDAKNINEKTIVTVVSSDGKTIKEYKISFKLAPKPEEPSSPGTVYVPAEIRPDNKKLVDDLKENVKKAEELNSANDKNTDEKLKLLEKHKNEAAQLINKQLESQALKLEGKISQDKVTFEAKTDDIQKSIENFKSIRKEALEAIKDTSLSKAESLVDNAVVLDAKNAALGKSIELTIPQDAIKAIEKAGMVGVAVLTPEGKIVLSVKDISGDKDVKLLVKPVEAVTKNSSLSTPIDVEVQADGKVIEAFAQKVKIEVPLKSVPQNPDLIAVFKIKDNGEEELVPARYIESTNSVVFLRPSLSKYYAAEYVKKFNDVEDGKWYSTYIKAAAAKGAINGYTDGSFKPEEQITRAEFAAMVVKTFGIEYSSQEVSKFNDVSMNDWCYNFIAALYNNGIINGKSESSFAPDEYISREEMVVLIVKTMIKLGIIDKLHDGEIAEFSDAATISNWASTYVTTALNEGLIRGTGNGSFEPSRGITRAETAVVITNALRK